MTFLKQFLQKISLPTALLSLLILCLVSYLTSLGLAIIILSVLLAHRLVDSSLGTDYFDSKLSRWLLSFIFYFGLLQAVIVVVWLFDHNFPLTLSTAATLVVLILCLIWKKIVSHKLPEIPSPQQSLKTINATDGIALMLVTVLVALVMLPPLKDTRLDSMDSIFRQAAIDYANMGVDDSNHLTMLNDHLVTDRGVLYQTDSVQKIVMSVAINSYPPSWHSANAVLIKSFNPDIFLGGEVVVAYVFTKFFWFAALVYVFAKTTLYFVRAFSNKLNHQKATRAEYIWVVGALLFFGYYTLLEQFKEGFYSFIPELLVILLMATFLVQLAQDRVKFTDFRRHRSLLPLSVLVTFGTLTWFLIVPALALIVVCSHLLSVKKTGELVLDFSPPVFRAVGIFLPVLLLCAFAIALQVHLITSGTARSLSGGLTDPGAITFHSSWYYLFTVTGGIAMLILSAKKELLHYLAAFVLILLGFTLCIYLFLMASVGHIDYYFFKTLNTVMIVGVPLAIAGFAYILNQLRNHNQSSTLTGVVAAIIVLILPMGIGIEPTNTSNLSYIKGSRSFTPAENEKFYKILNEQGNQAKHPGMAVDDYVAFIPGDVAFNRIATSLLRINSKYEDCHQQSISTMLEGQSVHIFDSLRSCPAGHNKLTVLTKMRFVDMLSADAEKDGVRNRLNFVPID